MARAAGTDATLRRWVDQRGFSGSLLVTRGGEAVLEGSYGLANRADGVPVTPRTRFGLASFTKMFTAVSTVGLLHEHGVPYDAPVVGLLPPERRPSTLREDVTVHHLLTHTSGIADYFEEADEGADFAALWAQRPSYTMRRPVDFLPLFGELAPYRPPGRTWQYSNAGYILLGLVLEELAGLPYADVVQRRVFDRAGMTGSGFFGLDEVVPDVAVGYLPPAAEGLPWRSNIFSVPVVGGADGGALATARDVDRFLRAFGEGTLVGPGLRDLMLQSHARADPGIACGYGVFVYERDGRWGHGGGDPGVEVFGYRLPAQDLNLVVLCNVAGFTSEVRDLLLEEFAERCRPGRAATGR
jgi:CubicO group peptidase (beta-lactamase class C family)